MNALITGGAGFVGSALARALKARLPQATVVALDNLKRRGSELNIRLLREHDVTFVHGDVRNREDLDALDRDFDVLIDASAEPSVHAGTTGSAEYLVSTNLMGTFNCLNFARTHARKFILLSTSRVYSIQALRGIQLMESPTRFEIADLQSLNGVSKHGISEGFPTNTARSFYGTTKLAAEYLTQEFAESCELRTLVYRCSVIAGPGQFGKADQGVFTMWVASHYFRRPLRYTGFGGLGKQVRDLVHIDDLCGLVLGNLDRDTLYTGQAFNIGGGTTASTSLAELTEICRTVTGNTVAIDSVRETSAVDIPLYVSDCRRAEAEFHWKPVASVANIVEDTFRWIRNNETELKSIFA